MGNLTHTHTRTYKHTHIHTYTYSVFLSYFKRFREDKRRLRNNLPYCLNKDDIPCIYFNPEHKSFTEIEHQLVLNLIYR